MDNMHISGIEHSLVKSSKNIKLKIKLLYFCIVTIYFQTWTNVLFLRAGTA